MSYRLLLLLLAFPSALLAAKQPNVILVMADDMGGHWSTNSVNFVLTWAGITMKSRSHMQPIVGSRGPSFAAPMDGRR